jgi:hypothetical protein
MNIQIYTLLVGWSVWYFIQRTSFQGLLRLLPSSQWRPLVIPTSIKWKQLENNNLNYDRHCEVVALDNRSNLGLAYRVYLGCLVPRSDVSSDYCSEIIRFMETRTLAVNGKVIRTISPLAIVLFFYIYFTVQILIMVQKFKCFTV